jgi:hypothetical protein
LGFKFEFGKGCSWKGKKGVQRDGRKMAGKGARKQTCKVNMTEKSKKKK